MQAAVATSSMQKCREVTISEEIHTSEANTSGVNTPTKERTPKHWISTETQHPTLICDVGSPTPIPTSQRHKAGLTHTGERKQHKRVLAR